LSEKDGKRSFFRVDAETHGLSRWSEQISSFERAHVELHLGLKHPGFPAEAIVEEQVECRAAEALLEAQNLLPLRLLQIDAEGYDGQLVRSFPFHRTQPDLIRFEAMNLEQADLDSTLEHLVQAGYRFHLEPTGDCIAVHDGSPLADPAYGGISEQNG